MRITRYLLLMLLACGAAFVLSGCDLLAALLADDSISVSVSVKLSDHASPTDPASYTEITVSGPSSQTQTVYNAGSDATYAYYSADFTKLQDGDYTITADYWGKNGVLFNGYPEQSASVTLSSSSSSTKDASVSLTFN